MRRETSCILVYLGLSTLFLFMNFNKTHKALQLLIEATCFTDLHQDDVNHASEFLKHGEYGLCLDHLVIQLYEYGIEIDSNIYGLIEYVGRQISIPPDEYEYAAELVQPGDKVSSEIGNRIEAILK